MPTGNYLIDSLDDAARAALLSVLTRCVVKGETLIVEGDLVDRVHFPTTAHLINRAGNARGQTLQVGFVGPEGVSGLPAFLAGTPCSWTVISQGHGAALTGSARDVRRIAETTPALMSRLIGLSHFYQAVAHQQVIAASFETIVGRLAFWLLTAFDLVGRREIRVTQGEIARHLGVQRTSIVSACGELTGAGAIKLARGRVTLVNEQKLQQLSGGLFDNLCRVGQQTGVLPTEEWVES